MMMMMMSIINDRDRYGFAYSSKAISVPQPCLLGLSDDDGWNCCSVRWSFIRFAVGSWRKRKTTPLRFEAEVGCRWKVWFKGQSRCSWMNYNFTSYSNIVTSYYFICWIANGSYIRGQLKGKPKGIHTLTIYPVLCAYCTVGWFVSWAACRRCCGDACARFSGSR